VVGDMVPFVVVSEGPDWALSVPRWGLLPTCRDEAPLELNQIGSDPRISAAPPARPSRRPRRSDPPPLQPATREPDK
jgi:hypothetical protein